MRFGVIVFPGSNCDHDAYHAIKHVLGRDTVFVWHKEEELHGADVLIVPGGFSYGDYLRPGAIARFSPVMESVRRHAEAGKPVLGICNGFQILQEARLLPGVMLPNSGLKFICRRVTVRVETDRTPFTVRCRPGRLLSMPVAHHDGNFFLAPDELERLEANGQVVFRYAGPDGRVSPEFNPNGSLNSIAGVCNREGNVVALMPHPERASEALLGSRDGRVLFQSVVETFHEQPGNHVGAH